MGGNASDKLADVLDGFGEAMSRLMVDQLQKHLAELDLTIPQVQVLRMLHQQGTVPTGKLAQCLKISAPATTQLTDRLLRKGLIERRHSEDDRRAVLVALSVDGQSLIDKFRERRNAIFGAALSSLSEAEQAEVISSLQKLIAALTRFDAKIKGQ